MNDDPQRSDRLRAELTAVADRYEPDADAWDRIRADLDRPTGLQAVPRPSPRSRRWGAVAAVAAVLVVIAAIGAAVWPDGDRGVELATTPEEATGWYIPVGLPEGWSARSVTVQRMDQRCPCRVAVWADADRAAVVTAQSEPTWTDENEVTVVEPAAPEPFELIDGIDATLDSVDAPVEAWTVVWEADGQHHVVTGAGVPAAEALAIARAIASDPGTDSIPLDGVGLIESWEETGAVGLDADVQVEMETPDHRLIDYTISSRHRFLPYLSGFAPTDLLADRQPLPVLGERFLAPGDERIRDYLGMWPGSTTRVLGGFNGETGATDEEIADFAASLRPATASEWRAFVATAGNRDRAATASATFDDLIEGRTAPVAAEPAEGDLGDLDLSLAVTDRVAPWEDATAVLTARNPTSSAITDPRCTLDRTRIALLPADASTQEAYDAVPAGEPWWSDSGACDGGTTIEPGAAKTIRLVVRAQFHDARYGPLPSGPYEATARVEGVAEPLTASIAVGGQDCTGSTTAFPGMTVDAARSFAEGRGTTDVRTPEPGTESEVSTQRCDRLNLVVGDDGLVVFARFY